MANLKALGVYSVVTQVRDEMVPVKGHETRVKSLMAAFEKTGVRTLAIPSISASNELIQRERPDIIISDSPRCQTLAAQSFNVLIYDDTSLALYYKQAGMYLFPSGGMSPFSPEVPAFSGIVVNSFLEERHRGIWSFPENRKILVIERGPSEAFWDAVHFVVREARDIGADVEIIRRDQPIAHGLLINKMLSSTLVITTASTTAKEAAFLGCPTVIVKTAPGQSHIYNHLIHNGLARSEFEYGTARGAINGAITPSRAGRATLITNQEVVNIILNEREKWLVSGGERTYVGHRFRC